MIARLLGLQVSEQGLPEPTADFWYQDASGFRVGAGVSADTAMRLSAVYACVRVLSEGVAALPLKLYRRRDDGGKELATEHYLYSTLHDMPNYFQSSMEFWEQAMNALTLRGNFVARIGGRAGFDTTLEPIPIDDVQEVQRVGTNGLRYKVLDADDVPRWIDSEQIFHVRGMSADGLWGANPIAYHRNAIGLALGAEEFGSSLFKRGVRPSGVIEMDKSLSETAYKRLRDSISSEYGGSQNAAKTLILEDGGKWKQMSMTPEDAQFIDTRKFQLEEIARLFRVPPHMIGDLSRATFSNIEHQSINFVVHTLRPWLVRIEQAIKRDLIRQKSKYFAEFTVDGLLRGDVKSRYESYAVAVQNEILSSNEVRSLENMNPREGGDEYRNPAINPHNATDVPVDGQASRIAASYIGDIAGRMATRELRELSKRVKHAATGREQFDEWLQSFYESHAQAIDDSIGGLCEALQVRNVDRVSAVESIITENIRELSVANPEATVADWENGKLKSRYINTLKGLTA